MSWMDIVPAGKPSIAANRTAVEFSVSRQLGVGKNKDLIILVTVRLPLLARPPAFLEPGRRFRAMLGQGEHTGLLRIEEGADFLVGKAGGPKSREVLCLRLPRPPCVKAEKCQSPTDYDWNDDWLEVSIPKWALVAPLAAPSAMQVAEKGFASALAGVKHDVRRGA